MDERRQQLGRTWDNVAQRGSTNAETIRQVRVGGRRIRDITKRAIEIGLDWQPGSVDAILHGGEPVHANINPADLIATTDDAGPDVAELDYEISMIERSDLPVGAKRAMVRELHRIRDRQLAEHQDFLNRQRQALQVEVERMIEVAHSVHEEPSAETHRA